MIRIAAVGDVHVGLDSAGRLAPRLAGLADQADVLLLAGDLTRRGPARGGRGAGRGAGRGRRPDRRRARQPRPPLRRSRTRSPSVLEAAGVTVLEGEAVVVEAGGARLGVAGTKGFGGGFAGASGQRLRRAGDEGVRRPHQEPWPAGWSGPWPGSTPTSRRPAPLLAGGRHPGRASRPRSTRSSAATCWPRRSTGPGPTSSLHGHAHRGSRTGTTPGGVPVRNVAAPVIGRAYEVFRFDVEEG